VTAGARRHRNWRRAFSQRFSSGGGGGADERLRPILGKLRDSEYGMDVARASLVLERPDERHRLRQSGVGDGHL